MITISITNVYCQIHDLTDHKIIDKLDNKLSYYQEGYLYSPAYKRHVWDGKVRMLSKQLKFQTGMLPYVEKILQDNDVEYNIIDNRQEIVLGKEIPLVKGYFEPRDYQIEIVKRCLEYKCGIIKSATGCHAKGQGILMYNGSIKLVEDIVVGDQLMGLDSKPRNVLELCRGMDDVYEIIPTKGKSFIVNGEHILSLQRTRKRKIDNKAGNIIDISVSNWLKWNKTDKHIHKLFRVGAQFNNYSLLPLDPYLLGLLLGDGHIGNNVSITTADSEIIQVIYEYGKKLDLNIRKSKDQINNKANSYYFTLPKHLIGRKINGSRRTNILLNICEKLGLRYKTSEYKFIPEIYKIASFNMRLEILAGLMDTDGSYTKGGFDYISKSKMLADDVVFIARSVGLAAYIAPCHKYDQNGNGGLYYRVSISGNIDIIPCRIKRKKASIRKQIKNVLRTGFKVIDLKKKENYYGFILDGDRRYLLDDFTVTHNSGKTLALSLLIGKTNIRTLVCVISLDLLYQTKKDIEDALGEEIGMVGDGICIIKKITVGTPWTIMRAFDKDYKPFDSEESVVKEHLDDLTKAKIKEMVENVQMLIVDEGQYLGGVSIQTIAKSAKEARYRLAFSGTPWRMGADSVLIEASTGPQLIDITATELIERNILVPPKIYFFDVPELDGYKMENHDKKTYSSVYEGYIVHNKVRNDMIVKSAEGLFNKGRKILILVKRKAHGLKLLKMLPAHIKSYFLCGDANSDERSAVKQLINMDGLDIIVASSIYDQGIDIGKLDALILCGSGKSSGRALQRLGRVIRGYPGKKDAIVVDFIDRAPFVFNHSKLRHAIYTTEPAFQIKLPEDIDW